MPYKLIAIDLDGTLLDSNKLISKENIEALHKAQENGLRLVISTGRVIQSAISYMDAIGLKTDYITCNGAEICYDHLLELLFMDVDETIRYVSLCIQLDIDFNVVTENHSYYFKNYKNYDEYYKDNEMVQSSKVLARSIFHELDEIVHHLKNEKIIKICMFHVEESKFNRMFTEFDKDKFNIVSAEERNIDVMEKNASKGNAVKKIAGHYGIKKKEILVIGDSGNDLDMFHEAGLSVAMGNADRNVIELADMITDTNDNSGVAKALESLKLV